MTKSVQLLRTELRFGEPTHALIEMPQSLSVMSVGEEVPGLSMPFSVQPGPFISAAVWPVENPPSVFIVAEVLALVSSAIGPFINSLSMHHVVFPLSLIASPIFPCKGSFSFHHVLHPSATIAAVIIPYEFSYSVLFSCSELTIIAAAVGPLVNTLSILQILAPMASIPGPVGVKICAFAMSFVVEPISLIKISIRVVEFPVTSGFALEPFSLILCSIWPLLHSHSMFRLVLPFTFILNIAFQLHFGNCVNHRIVLNILLCLSFNRLISVSFCLFDFFSLFIAFFFDEDLAALRLLEGEGGTQFFYFRKCITHNMHNDNSIIIQSDAEGGVSV